MFSIATLLYLYVESPLHAGVGFRDDTTADLPIQREKSTEYPVIRASSLKGSLRALARTTAEAEDVTAAFGPEPESIREKEEEGQAEDEATFMGALVLGDARLLLFPVRSLAGIFTWVTSADALARFVRDAAAYGLSPGLPSISASPPAGTAWVTSNSQVVTGKSQLVLEELTFQAKAQKEAAALGDWFATTVFPLNGVFAYWSEKIQTDLAVLPEEDFRFFVTTRTEIAHRIRINPATGTAVEGALWSEELLPADTVLYTAIGGQEPTQPGKQLKSAQDALAWIKGLGWQRIQVGGGRTLGRGIIRLRWADGGSQP